MARIKAFYRTRHRSEKSISVNTVVLNFFDSRHPFLATEQFGDTRTLICNLLVNRCQDKKFGGTHRAF